MRIDGPRWLAKETREDSTAALNPVERDALIALTNGGSIQQEALELLVKKKLVRANPLEFTEAGRIVCALLQEIETLQREDDATTRGSY